jgi:hypothetical protein
LFSIKAFVLGIEIDDDEHPLKQLFSIEASVFGIEMGDNDEHSLK